MVVVPGTEKMGMGPGRGRSGMERTGFPGVSIWKLWDGTKAGDVKGGTEEEVESRWREEKGLSVEGRVWSS